jgi:hypothetical protein
MESARLEIPAGSAEAFGAGLAERIGSESRRIRTLLGPHGATAGAMLRLLKEHRLFSELAGMRAKFRSAHVGLDTPLDRAVVALGLSDVNEAARNLRGRGYEDKQVARFRTQAWRAFKLAIREAATRKAN